MTRLLIRSFCTNDQIDFGAFALVTLADVDILLIAKRRKAFIAARAEDQRLCAAHFHVAFTCGSRGAYAHFYPAVAEIERGSEKQSVATFLEGEAYLALADDIRVVSKPAFSAVHRMSIGDDGVRWTAIGGRPGTSTTTAEVSYPFLFEGRL